LPGKEKAMTTQSITPKQEKQYDRFLEDAGNRARKEVNPDKEGLQRLFARGGEFQAYVVAGIRRFSAVTPNYDLARTILGKDFISPEEVTKSRGVAYTDDQLAKFGDTLPSQEVLEWCRDNGYMIVAGPNKSMSLLEVRELKSEYFYSKQGGWYTGASETFSRNDKVGTGWIMIRKDPVPESIGKNWNEQQVLLSEVEITPNAAEVVWAVTTYKAVRGVNLLPSPYVRTSSLDSVGRRVSVGYFDSGGLDVNVYWVNRRHDNLGVSAARK
jgi:hypothetical protein